jgi:hypothetical protein
MRNFLIFFLIGIITNALFKSSLNLLTAFSVAIGLSFGVSGGFGLIFSKKKVTINL